MADANVNRRDELRVNPGTKMETILHDIRYGLRTLLKHNITFTLAAVLTLGLGIGATTAIFSVVNSVLLRPLPYKDPDKIVTVYEQNLVRGLDRFRVSLADFTDLKDQNEVFNQIAAIRFKTFLLTGASEPEWVSGGAVSASLFPLLGVEPILGQPFLSEQEQPANSNVAMISYSLWQRSLGADQNIIGQVLTLDGQGYIVIGVMPPGFEFPKKFDLWVPLTINPGAASARRARFLQVVARLKEGVKLDDAQIQMGAIAHQLEEAYPDTNAGWGVELALLYQDTVGNIGRALMILLSAVGFVLLIACANVANLLLVRAAAREKGVAIRTALGAGKRRLIQQNLTETILLAAIGGVVGFLLSLWGINFLVYLAPADIPRIAEVKVDIWVFAFALVVSLLTGIIFGLMPALRTSDSNLSSVLKQGAQRSAGGVRSYRTLRVLAVFEVAFAIILLTGATLMIRSFIRLQNVDPGFNSANILTMRVSLPESKYPQATQQKFFFQQLIEKTAALSGVLESGAITQLPIGDGNSAFPIAVEGRPQTSSEEQPIAFYNAVSSNYFRTMSIALMRGRYFTENDEGEMTPKIVIIDEALARRFWNDQDPIGKRLIIISGKPSPHEIVGVVKTLKYHSLESNITIPAMYVPYLQSSQSRMVLVARSVSDPTRLANLMRDEVRKLDKDQPVSQIRTMDYFLSESLSQKRFYTLLLTSFAIIAVILAAVGIYGVMSYSVTQRTHEIGIRMALGAQRGDILKMVVGQNVTLIIAGAMLGLTGAFALTRFLASLLYEVTATDPFSFLIVIVMLVVTALLACYIPARKAIMVDPIIALRYE